MQAFLQFWLRFVLILYPKSNALLDQPKKENAMSAICSVSVQKLDMWEFRERLAVTPELLRFPEEILNA